MNRIFKKILLGLCLLMLSAGVAKAQQICDPASDPYTPGSCQDLQGANLPGCYDCVLVGSVPNCVPQDSFCNDISGGTSANDCRVGVCVASPVPDPSVNPSGCDYTLTPDASDACILCSSPAPTSFDSCGNGVCEPGLGETCGTCSDDCRLPGFPAGVCPLPADSPVFSQPFVGTCDESGIVFDGPPYNQIRGQCEDGDLCTNNNCSSTNPGNCDSTPKGCSLDTADFCCPSGCDAPPPNGLCGNDVGCDTDCYIPQVCEPTPLPTPTPPPPPFVGCLEGSGMHGNSGGAGCKGFSCSLDPATATNAASAFGASALSLVALASGLMVRRRKR